MTKLRRLCPSCAAEIIHDPPVLDLNHLYQITELEVFRPGLRDQLLELFTASAQTSLDECWSARRCNDRHGLALAAHRLKGSAASLGAVRLKDLADHLECKALDEMCPAISSEQLDQLSESLGETISAYQNWLGS